MNKVRQLQLGGSSPCSQFVCFSLRHALTEKKTQVPREWSPHKVLKNSFVIPVVAKRMFCSSEWSHKVQNQGREHCARIKCLPMFLKLPTPFSSSLGVAQASTCDQRSMA